MKQYLFLLFTILCVGCTQTEQRPIDSTEKDWYIDKNFLMGKAKNKAIDELRLKYNFNVSSLGNGGSAGVQISIVGGKIPYNPSKEEARRMSVDAGKIFLKHINRIKNLRPALCSYPFPIERVEVTFFPWDIEKNQYLSPRGFFSFGLRQGYVHYTTDTQEKYSKLISENEPYKKAKEIVEKGKPKEAQKRPQGVIIPVPEKVHKERSEYGGPDYEIDMQFFIDDLGRKLAHEHDLRFLWTGNFSYDRKRWRAYCLSFYGFKQLSLEESKTYMHTLFHSYYHALSGAPEIRDYYKKHCETTPWLKYSDTPPVHEVGIKITFWDEGFDPRVKPNIAKIILLDGTFSYYQADPDTHELTRAHTETWDEVMQNNHDSEVSK